MSKNRSDVMVVGAGPTGLAAACELARRGVAVRVIDKLPAPTTESRAILVHARSLEMFDQMGVAVTTPQTETERILGERLAGLGVTVERGVELTARTQDADAAHPTLVHPATAPASSSAPTELLWIFTPCFPRVAVHDRGGRLLGCYLREASDPRAC